MVVVYLAAKIISQDKETRLYIVTEAHKPTLKVNTGFIIFTFGARAKKRIKKCFKKYGPFGMFLSYGKINAKK